MSLSRIVVGGEALVDLVPPVAGGPVDAHLGGGPFTTARTLGRLGAQVSFLGALSTDLHGRRLRAALQDDGVDLSLAVSTDRRTTSATATRDADGSAAYAFDVEGTSAPALGAATLPDDTGVLHVGTLGLLLEPMATTLRGLVRAHAGRALVMLDPNCRPSLVADRAAFAAMLADLLPAVDVLKCSRDDLAWLSGGQDPLAHAAQLRRLGPAVALVTDGPRGAWVLTGDGAPRHVPSPPADVVDTIGAGDAFGGGWLAWWARAGLGRAQLPDPDALDAATRFACSVAARTCERAGARPPTAAELQLD